MFWLVRGRIDAWLKTYQLTNPSTNTRKIVKLYADVCGYGCDYVNVNVAVSASANDNITGYVNVCEKIFCVY